MRPSTEPRTIIREPARRYDGWIALLLFVAMLGVSTCIAWNFYSQESPLVGSALLGAAVGVSVFLYGVAIVGAIRRLPWRVYGFPFLSGDRVTVTGGPFSSAEGLVQFADQSRTGYFVQLKGQPEDTVHVISGGHLQLIERAS